MTISQTPEVGNNVKLDVSWQKGLPFKVADFIGIRLFNFEWHSQNKVGNIGSLALWRDRKKLGNIGLID